ncbi:hypothetical protein [Shewanella frigidimarina]|uniref:Uncharacterized protein n=1 Tax=Shewanella frigidimarina TaxID=56812 RepID=A0A106BYK6_SHEFR|nr:hypothetical protein [Shewanella frigidimarina]KVX00978.1 hypothetical protein AWJ07_05825 [Shewanella frigidimarina]
MNSHVTTLSKLISEGVVTKIDSSSDYELSTIEDLLNSGYINATPSRPISGDFSYFNVKVNLVGKEWFESQKAKFDLSLSTGDDIVDLKPNFMGIGLNLNALYHRFRRK